MAAASSSAETALPDLRAAIVAAARGWIGTPYLHQASLKGAGADCLGLVRGVWREVIGPEPETPPPYTPGWAEAQGRETMLEAAGRWLVPATDAWAGDVIFFRWRPDLPAKHCAVVSAVLPTLRIVHAYQDHAVQEVDLPPAWRRRIAACFSFPAAERPAAPAGVADGEFG